MWEQRKISRHLRVPLAVPSMLPRRRRCRWFLARDILAGLVNCFYPLLPPPPPFEARASCSRVTIGKILVSSSTRLARLRAKRVTKLSSSESVEYVEARAMLSVPSPPQGHRSTFFTQNFPAGLISEPAVKSSVKFHPIVARSRREERFPLVHDFNYARFAQRETHDEESGRKKPRDVYPGVEPGM